MNGSGNPRVTGKGGGHGPGNDLLILLQVRQRSKRQSPVGDLSSPSVVSDSVGLVGCKSGTYWTPKMSACVHKTQVSASDEIAPEKKTELKKYSLAAGERSQAVKVEAILFLGEGMSGAGQTQ